jgi:hypothetical protein
MVFLVRFAGHQYKPSASKQSAPSRGTPSADFGVAALESFARTYRRHR